MDPSSQQQLVVSPKALESFADDVQYLWCLSSANEIAVYDEPPSALTFLREHVAVSRPCLIRKALPTAINHGKPLGLDELVQLGSPDLELTVDVTPDGHGDTLRLCIDKDDDTACSTSRAFVKPEERTMRLADFVRDLRESRRRQADDRNDASPTRIRQRVFPWTKPKAEPSSAPLDPANAVLYYSRQNDCLRTEFQSISHLFPSSFPWAEQAFGADNGPDAINLWMGDERAVSSMHKDHYENLFCVLSGEKVFTLCPPADAPFLYERAYDSGTFQWNGDQWTVVPDKQHDDNDDDVSSQVQWIAADVKLKDDPSRLLAFPLLRHTHPVEIRVRAGEMLYLPSLWFHRVAQTRETVAINYWYDMKFNSPLWCYFHLLQQMTPPSSRNTNEQEQQQQQQEEVDTQQVR